MAALLLHRAQVGIVHPQVVGSQFRNLTVIQKAHLPGVLDERGDVAGQIVSAVAEAQNQRAVLSGSNEPVRAVGAQDAQGVGAPDGVEGTHHCVQQVALIVILQQLGRHLGIGIRHELHSLGLEEFPQLSVVFDDTVVDYGEPAILADLGVGIDVRRGPVGSPPGMAHANGAVKGASALNQVVEHLKPPFGLGHLHSFFCSVYRYTGGIIPPVLQPGQAVQQNWRGLLPSNISNNPAHGDPPAYLTCLIYGALK